METNKKEKVINFGVTDELISYLDKWMMEQTKAEENRNKKEEPGLEVKRVIVEISKGELAKIKEKLEDKNLKNSEWNDLMERVDKISGLIRWY